MNEVIKQVHISLIPKIDLYIAEYDRTLILYHTHRARHLFSIQSALKLTVEDAVNVGGNIGMFFWFADCLAGAGMAASLVFGTSLQAYLDAILDASQKVKKVKELSSIGGNIGMSLLIF